MFCFFVHIHVVCLYDVFQHHLVLTKERCLRIIGSAEDKSTWGRQVRGQECYSHCSHNTNQLTKQINKDRPLRSYRKHAAVEVVEQVVVFVLHLLEVHIYMPVRADVFIFFYTHVPPKTFE